VCINHVWFRFEYVADVAAENGLFVDYAYSPGPSVSLPSAQTLPAGDYFISYTNSSANSTAQLCPSSTATCYRYYNTIDSNGDITGAPLGSAVYNHFQRPWYVAAKSRFAANPVSAATAAWGARNVCIGVV
jgi:hypothetical protein